MVNIAITLDFDHFARDSHAETVRARAFFFSFFEFKIDELIFCFFVNFLYSFNASVFAYGQVRDFFSSFFFFFIFFLPQKTGWWNSLVVCAFREWPSFFIIKQTLLMQDRGNRIPCWVIRAILD